MWRAPGACRSDDAEPLPLGPLHHRCYHLSTAIHCRHDITVVGVGQCRAQVLGGEVRVAHHIAEVMATEKKQFSLVLVTYLWLFRIIFHILFFSLIYRNWWNFITHIVLVFKESAFIVVRIFLLCSFSIDVLNLGLNLTLFVLLTFTTAHAKNPTPPALF